jgi:hypothetical protein
MSDDEPDIRAHLGKVLLPRYDSENGWVDETYTPDAARRLIRQLIAAINIAEHQVVAIRAACADGHLWDDGFNSIFGERHTVYHCTRDGCEATKDEPGWLPFEPKLHHVPFAPTPRDCTGPGCSYCSDEAMAAAFRDFMGKTVVSINRGGIVWGQPNP